MLQPLERGDFLKSEFASFKHIVPKRVPVALGEWSQTLAKSDDFIPKMVKPRQIDNSCTSQYLSTSVLWSCDKFLGFAAAHLGINWKQKMT